MCPTKKVYTDKMNLTLFKDILRIMHVIFGKCIQLFRERLSETSSSRWLGRPIGSGGEDVIDENRFHIIA